MDEENVTEEQKQTQETAVEVTKETDTNKIEEDAEKPAEVSRQSNKDIEKEASKEKRLSESKKPQEEKRHSVDASKPTEATGTTDEKKPEEEKRQSVTKVPSEAKPAEEKRQSVTKIPSEAKPAEEKRTSDAKKPEEEKRASIAKQEDVPSTEEKRPSESKKDEPDKRLSEAKRPSDAKKEEQRESDASKRKSRRHSEARSDGERKSTVMEADRSGRHSSRSQLTVQKSFSRTKVRRQSYGFGSVPGIKPLDRTSQTLEYKRPPLIYLNTYQLEPHVRFNNQQVEDAAQDLMDEHFTEHVYNEARSPLLALRLSGELMRRVKHLLFNRYRIIAAVTIAQRRAQSYNNAIAFLWDRERDSYVDLHRENITCFMQITVFGVYFD